MKLVIYADSEGHLRRTYIRNSDPDNMAECGVPAGPPDVRLIDMDEFLKQLNHILVNAELFDWDDAQRKPGGLSPAINLFKRTLVNLYRQENKKQK
jgi:hypothetical protein